MTTEQLSKITQTIDGSLVKDLRWLRVDNIIVGRVHDKLLGNPNLNEGYVGAAWRSNGTPTNNIRGREELKLVLSL